VHVAEGAASFPSTFIGAASQLPLTLVNTTPVPATLLGDLTQQPEFELTISREDWAGAGYSACPVQRIGANGEMSTVGSMRASRRCAECVLKLAFHLHCGITCACEYTACVGAMRSSWLEFSKTCPLKALPLGLCTHTAG
jgi:hypothetical protein